LLRKLKLVRGPVLLHVLTVKGKGYRYAEEDSPRFHGIGAFDKTTGSSDKKATGRTFSAVFGETVVELGRQHSNIVAVSAAMTDGTGLTEFSQEFPQRFFDVGIAEQHAVTFAAGLASQRKRPIVAIYSTFLQRAFDQIVHDVALQKLPVVFAIDRGGVVGEDGPTHHGCFDLSYLRHIPNLITVAPKDENELVRMLHTAVRYTKGPMAIRYPRSACFGVPIDRQPRVLDIGRGELLKQGRDVVIFAVGSMVWPSLEAARLLEERRISTMVINARFIAPPDAELFSWAVREVGAVVTVEENSLAGGFGSAVLEVLERRRLMDHPVLRIGVPHRFVEHGDRKTLLAQLGLDAPSIAARIESWLRTRKERHVPVYSEDNRSLRER
jgi:1-deoxy-D-xylulose-5-phosphate synthase